VTAVMLKSQNDLLLKITFEFFKLHWLHF